MEIVTDKNDCIITILSPILYSHETIRLYEILQEYKNYKIAINMDNVIDCSIDFFELLSKLNNLNLYNITSDISAILYKMGLDKKVNLYNSELDFKSSSHRLLSRNLKLIVNQ